MQSIHCFILQFMVIIRTWLPCYLTMALTSQNLTTSETMQSPLHAACLHRNVSMVKLLLERGALMSVHVARGELVVLFVCKINYPDILEVLLSHNAGILFCDNSRQSLLDIAIEKMLP